MDFLMKNGGVPVSIFSNIHIHSPVLKSCRTAGVSRVGGVGPYRWGPPVFEAMMIRKLVEKSPFLMG